MIYLERIKTELANVDDEKTLKKTFSNVIKEMGYHGFDAYRLQSGIDKPINQPGNFFMNDYGLNLPWEYIDGGWMANDPTILEVGRRSAPFEYLSFLKNVQKSTSVRWQLNVLALQNVKQAWCIPLNEAGAIRGMTVYMRGNGEERQRLFTESCNEIQLMCSHFIEKLFVQKAENIQGKKNSQPTSQGLRISGREADCLQLVAQGKTNAEISRILSVSENTIRFHLKNAYRKLGVNNRASAVRQAFEREIIVR